MNMKITQATNKSINNERFLQVDEEKIYYFLYAVVNKASLREREICVYLHKLEGVYAVSPVEVC